MKTMFHNHDIPNEITGNEKQNAHFHILGSEFVSVRTGGCFLFCFVFDVIYM